MDFRPALFRQIQIHPGWCNVDKTVAVIQREIIVRLAFEFIQERQVVAFYPSRRGHVDGFELTFNFVLILQTMCHNIELKRPHGAQYQIVVPHRLE